MRDTRDQESLPDPLPPAPPSSSDGTPKFGRLLVVLALAMLAVVALTFGSEAYFT